MKGIGRAIVLARENDTPDRWGGLGLRPFPAKQGLGLPAVGIPSPARRGGALKQTRCALRHIIFYCPLPLACKHATALGNKKTGRFSSSGSFLRRGRDSNPRILSDQRFSRPPQSTTLPPLQVLRVCFGIAKVGIIFVSPNLFSRKLIFSAK